MAECDFLNREQFLYTVKHCVIEDPHPMPDSMPTRALLAAQHFHLVPASHECPTCTSSFHLAFRNGHYEWRGPRYSSGCADCNGRSTRVATIGFFRNEYQDLWMEKLDVLLMWIKEYPRATILLELSDRHHKTIDAWIDSFQDVFCDWAKLQITHGFDGKCFKALEKPTNKRPASASRAPAPRKKPAACMKKPSSARSSKKARIFVVDESHLNKHKPGKLSKQGRPQKDQIWIWGAVLQCSMSTHFIFKILKHPAEALDGKPRGHKEMLENLRSLGLRREDVLVSDKWKATVSSAKTLSHDVPFEHQIVNHSAGEIVNSDGYTTNHIEAKWSVVKRWIRKRNGGRLPNHSDRQKWTNLIYEYQARCLLRAQTPDIIDHGNFHILNFRAALRLFAVS